MVAERHVSREQSSGWCVTPRSVMLSGCVHVWSGAVCESEAQLCQSRQLLWGDVHAPSCRTGRDTREVLGSSQCHATARSRALDLRRR